MNVYNVVWADDEIDALINSSRDNFEEQGIKIIKTAHNGIELEHALEHLDSIDAIIVDANFNETDCPVENERYTSGLDYARTLYIKLNRSIPMFLYTNRSEELIRDIYKDNPAFLNDFKRNERWFVKSSRKETDLMLKKIKDAVDEKKTTPFIIRNRYQYELNAASLDDDTQTFINEFLIREYDNTLIEIKEPFVSVRRAIERLFNMCEKRNLIPPISNNLNGTANYFLKGEYVRKENDSYIKEYEMIDGSIMPNPLARSLKFIVEIVQDASHSKEGLNLGVNRYYTEEKDTWLLRAVVHILIDLVKWFAITALKHYDTDANAKTLWKKFEEQQIETTKPQNEI